MKAVCPDSRTDGKLVVVMGGFPLSSKEGSVAVSNTTGGFKVFVSKMEFGFKFTT